MSKMRYSTYVLPCLLALPLANAAQSATHSFQDQLQQAGAISQELNTTAPERLEKPAGQLFKQPVNVHSHSNNAIQFELQEIHVKVLDETGLQKKTSLDLTALFTSYLHRPITLEDLNQLTEKITQYYREHNYLVARAFLPPQEIDSGQLTIGVIEGEIGKIAIQNESRLSEQFVRRMANTSVNSQPYLAQNEVEKLALLLNDLSGVKSNLTIRAGQALGATDLQIKLQDSKLWKGYLFADNQGTAETGRYRLSGGVRLFNLAGLGDELNFNALASQNGRLKNARLDYSVLLDGYGTRLGAFYSYLDYKLGGAFAPLDAKGSNQSVGVYLLHPTIRTPNLHLNTKFTLLQNRITDSQSLAEEVKNRSRINLVSLDINGVWNSVPRGTTYFNLGASIGQEHNRSSEAYQNRPLDWQESNKFTLINAGIGHEQVLGADFTLDVNVKGQLADQNLSTSQKMLLGGQSGVRGYRSGAVSLDDGVVGQITLKHYIPLFKESVLTSSLFYDVGVGRKYHKIQTYTQRPEGTNQVKLQSLGAGLQLSAANNYAVQFYYSKPVGKKFANEKDHQVMLSLLKLF
ncbi:ShlB/FhaC/HecB family hemolysin secretion/activation protein [Avibacterium avium]|uniref:ShlB/FhaC/HecB family hemolysin secretion/activation protein n=1 Tax=Avibacterium avium TaxID=751 RepID=UPI003BF7C0ED